MLCSDLPYVLGALFGLAVGMLKELYFHSGVGVRRFFLFRFFTLLLTSDMLPSLLEMLIALLISILLWDLLIVGLKLHLIGGLINHLPE